MTSDSANNFNDVDGCTAEQKNAIGVLFDKGIVRGNGPDAYGPDTAVTRGVAALVIWNAAGKPTKTASGLPFQDIKEADWYYEAISNLYAMGVLTDADVIDGDQFKPDDPISETMLQQWLAVYDKSQGIGGAEPTVTTTANPDGSISATVTFPQGAGAATVTIPADVDYGMVAKDAKTGKIVKLSVPTEGGMIVKLDGSAELTLVNNAKDFTDTDGHWAQDAIDFATAHELFGGTDTTKALFSPDTPMTRAMLMTVLARFDGVDTTGGSVWYEKGMEWAKANGVSDGTNPNASITREQLATMLWRYAGSPAADGSLEGFTDADKVSGYAQDAMRWAVGADIINGMDGALAPGGSATRAQVATMLMRYVRNLTK